MKCNKLCSVEMIPFRSFKEKIELTKKYNRKRRMEIIDNKYVLLIKEKIRQGED